MAISDIVGDNHAYLDDPQSITVRSLRDGATQEDAVTQAAKLDYRRLRSAFGGVQLTSQQVGFEIWDAQLSNVTEIKPGDEIDQGTTTYTINQVTRTKGETSFLCLCDKQI